MLVRKCGGFCKAAYVSFERSGRRCFWRYRFCFDRHLSTSNSTWVFPKIGVPPNHPFVHRVFHCKPSILGYHYFWRATHILVLYRMASYLEGPPTILPAYHSWRTGWKKTWEIGVGNLIVATCSSEKNTYIDPSLLICILFLPVIYLYLSPFVTTLFRLLLEPRHLEIFGVPSVPSEARDS